MGTKANGNDDIVGVSNGSGG